MREIFLEEANTEKKFRKSTTIKSIKRKSAILLGCLSLPSLSFTHRFSLSIYLSKMFLLLSEMTETFFENPRDDPDLEGDDELSVTT